MARTNETDVKATLMKDYDTANAPSLTVFINSATRVVDRVATCAAAKGITLSSEELTDIEMWLASHFYVCSDRAYKSRQTEKAGATFDSQTAMGLDATVYGQQAKILDWSGCLAAITMGAKSVYGAWLGKQRSEERDYEERHYDE